MKNLCLMIMAFISMRASAYTFFDSDKNSIVSNDVTVEFICDESYQPNRFIFELESIRSLEIRPLTGDGHQFISEWDEMVLKKITRHPLSKVATGSTALCEAEGLQREQECAQQQMSQYWVPVVLYLQSVEKNYFDELMTLKDLTKILEKHDPFYTSEKCGVYSVTIGHGFYQQQQQHQSN